MSNSEIHDDSTHGGSSGASPPAPPLRVLVAEDFEPVRTLTARMLTKLGHGEVDEAEDGQEAVDALAAKHYDLLLLDLSMPRLTGVDVVRWLHAHPEHAEGLTVAVLSASAHAERPMLNELGVTLVLPKPVRIQQLSDLIDEVQRER